MHIKFFQNIIDILRFKLARNKVYDYLNTHPIFLKTILNIMSFLPKNGYKQKASILRFCGAKIGKNTKIGDNIYIFNPQNFELGDYAGISNSVLYCWDKIYIGGYTMVATNSVFVAGSHKTDDFKNLENQEIKIEKGCWIGANCTILGGGTFCRGSVLAAGSVLLGDGEYPPFSIFAGVPAKLIKKRTPAETIYAPIEYKLKQIFEN